MLEKKNILIRQLNRLFRAFTSLVTYFTKVEFTPETCREKLSCYSKISSTGKFRTHCSRDLEAPRRSEVIACQFACIYLSAASANFFEYQVLIMPCPPQELEEDPHRIAGYTFYYKFKSAI